VGGNEDFEVFVDLWPQWPDTHCVHEYAKYQNTGHKDNIY